MNSFVSLKRAVLIATLLAICTTMLPLSGWAESGSRFYLHAGYALDDRSPPQGFLSVLRMTGSEYYVWKTGGFATEQTFVAGTWIADLWLSTDVVTGDRPTQFAVAVGIYSQSGGFLGAAHAYTPIVESTSPTRYQATITSAAFNVGAGESFAVGLLRQWQNASYSPVAFAFFDSPERPSSIISPQGGPPQSSFAGFAFAVVGIGAGLGAAAGGLAVAAGSRPCSGAFVYAGYYYCRKHRVPLWSVRGWLWCPVERRFLRA